MRERRNKIWDLIHDGIYVDIRPILERWDNDENRKLISTLRNNEADEDAKGKHILLCPYCEKPICIRYQKLNQYPYIRHKFSTDSENCIIEDSSKKETCQSIVRARKYEGRTTGYLHKKVVSQITDVRATTPRNLSARGDAF